MAAIRAGATLWGAPLAVGAVFTSATTAQTLPFSEPPLWEVGAMDTPREEVFGRIRDLAVGPDGSVYVLDDLTYVLRWFDAGGTYLGEAGRQGQGPGEFSAPFSVAVDADGLVHVLDPRNRRISVFGEGAAGLELKNDIPVVPARDLCVLGTRRFLLMYAGLAEGGMIHEVDNLGRTLNSFGELPRADPEMLRRFPTRAGELRDQYGDGLIACDTEYGRIVFAHSISAVVEAYTADGKALWDVSLPDYHQRSFVEGRRPGSIALAPDPKTNTAHTTAALALVDGYVYVTLHEGSLADPEGSLELRVLRLRDGVEIARQPAKVLVAGHAPGWVVGFGQTPYPRVVAYSVGGD